MPLKAALPNPGTLLRMNSLHCQTWSVRVARLALSSAVRVPSMPPMRVVLRQTSPRCGAVGWIMISAVG